MSVLIALLLVVEGLSTGLWIAKLVPVIGGFSAAAIVLAVFRVLVGAMQLVSGAFIIAGRRSAVGLARIALMASALLTTLEIGARITPNNLVPGWRWPLVTGYWVYALGAAAYLKYEETRRDRNWRVRERAESGVVVRNREVPEEKTAEVQEAKSPEVKEEKSPEAKKEKSPEAKKEEFPTGDPTESGERPRLFE